jgi:hypothetical protein
LSNSDKCDSGEFGISGYTKSSDSIRISHWTRQRSSNSSPELLDGPGREEIAATLLIGSNGTSPPFVRAPAEDRSKYEKLIHDFEDVSSDDSHTSQPEAGNVLCFVVIGINKFLRPLTQKVMVKIYFTIFYKTFSFPCHFQ